MVKLTIDGREVEVEAGTKVIDAAERLGIMIPRFCYLKSLGAVGACRMCAVKFLDGHKKDLDMSCMVDVRDGMVVSTDHPDAVEFRARIIEWLMLSHPHDCPVCDEGGHCLLQDMTVSGGHSRRNYRGLKRTYENQDMGPLIAHEMNRCIHCYRCVRFYREYAGGDDYGTFGIAERVWYGRFQPGRLESPFAGNLAEICPTGTLTDKPSRYRARRWDLERAPSLCLHCSLGCNTTASVRYREVLRMEARENEAINGEFLCDRGRYGFAYASLPERPREARLNNEPVTAESAVQEAMHRLREAVAEKGPESVAVFASTRCSLEDLLDLRSLTAGLGIAPPISFMTDEERRACRFVAERLDRDIRRDLRQVREADCVLVLGADPLQEAPMAALAIRQAARAEAPVIVLDPRPVDLPCDVTQLSVPQHLMPAMAARLLVTAFPEAAISDGLDEFLKGVKSLSETLVLDDSETESRLLSAAKALARAERPVVVVSTEGMPSEWFLLEEGLVRLLRSMGQEAGLCPLLPGANAFGAALLDESDGRSLQGVLEAVHRGEVSSLVCVGGDPLLEYPREQWVMQCLEKLDMLVCLDCVPSATMRRADVALPTTTIFESGGSFVNSQGMMQRAAPVFAGGMPVTQDGAGSHPPRNLHAGIPGNDPSTVGQWVQWLRHEDNLAAQAGAIADGCATLFGIMRTVTPDRPMDILPEKSGASSVPVPDFSTIFENDEGHIMVARKVFGSDSLANYGSLGETLSAKPEICLHPAEAETLGLDDGDMVLVPLAEGLARGVLRIRESMARHTVVIFRVPGSGWQRVGGVSAPLALHRLWKEQSDEELAGESCQGGRL